MDGVHDMGGMHGFGDGGARRRGLPRALGARASSRSRASPGWPGITAGPLARGDRVDAARRVPGGVVLRALAVGARAPAGARRDDRAGRRRGRDRAAGQPAALPETQRPRARRARVEAQRARRARCRPPRRRASAPASACACAACGPRATRAARATCAAPSGVIERVHGDDQPGRRGRARRGRARSRRSTPCASAPTTSSAPATSRPTACSSISGSPTSRSPTDA